MFASWTDVAFRELLVKAVRILTMERRPKNRGLNKRSLTYPGAALEYLICGFPAFSSEDDYGLSA